MSHRMSFLPLYSVDIQYFKRSHDGPVESNKIQLKSGLLYVRPLSSLKRRVRKKYRCFTVLSDEGYQKGELDGDLTRKRFIYVHV